MIKEYINDQGITLMTDAGSTCELSLGLDEVFIDTLAAAGISVDRPVAWFARIKARKESEGEGTRLMRHLCDLVDRLSITIVNYPNPYGRMDMEELVRWYQKYGFELLNDGGLVRRPKLREKENVYM